MKHMVCKLTRRTCSIICESLSMSIFICAIAFTSCSDASNEGGNSTSIKKISSITYYAPSVRDNSTNTITFGNIYYNTENRLRRFITKEEYPGYRTTYKYYTSIEISYSSGMATINASKSTSISVPFTMNEKGFLTSLVYPTSSPSFRYRLELTYNGDYLCSIKMSSEGVYEGKTYTHPMYEARYEWKDGVIDKMKKIVYSGDLNSNDKKESEIKLSYTNKPNRNYIFPLLLSTEHGERFSSGYPRSLDRLINTIGMNGMLGRCPTLLIQESSSGEFYNYEFDNEGNVVEYSFSPAHSGFVETAFLKY